MYHRSQEAPQESNLPTMPYVLMRGLFGARGPSDGAGEETGGSTVGGVDGAGGGTRGTAASGVGGARDSFGTAAGCADKPFT